MQIYGDFTLLLREHPTVFAYKRSLEGVTAVILMNFSTQDVELELPLHDDPEALNGVEVVLTTYPDFSMGDGKRVKLRGYEGVLFRKVVVE